MSSHTNLRLPPNTRCSSTGASVAVCQGNNWWCAPSCPKQLVNDGLCFNSVAVKPGEQCACRYDTTPAPCNSSDSHTLSRY